MVGESAGRAATTLADTSASGAISTAPDERGADNPPTQPLRATAADWLPPPAFLPPGWVPPARHSWTHWDSARGSQRTISTFVTEITTFVTGACNDFHSLQGFPVSSFPPCFGDLTPVQYRIRHSLTAP